MLHREAFGRRALLAMVIALGTIGIVGSGGGFDMPQLGSPRPVIYSELSTVDVRPERAAVQSGSTVAFYAGVSFNGTSGSELPPYTFQWRRNGVDIPGATAGSYTLGTADIGDDGAVFEVRVTAPGRSVSGAAILRVSPFPALVQQDHEWPLSNWATASEVQPLQNAPTHAETQRLDGGYPGAYRNIAYRFPPGGGLVRVYHSWLAWTYFPAAQGPLLAVEFDLACERDSAEGSLADFWPKAWPSLEQSGRVFVSRRWVAQCTAWWPGRWLALVPEDFVLALGPPCGAGASCLDFSASGGPIRFGVATEVEAAAGSGGGAINQALDAWKVTVWRR